MVEPQYSSRLRVSESFESEVRNAYRLLDGDEKALPQQVENTIKYCTFKQVGFILSRNKQAGNCRDARNKRLRLGHIGIPFYDELKSIVGKTIDADGAQIIVAMHCRGHMAIDFEHVVLLGGFQDGIVPLPEDELMTLFGVKFGTVNPILLDLDSNVHITQVFDEGILEPISRFPGTMMTNAGDHTWGIEFDPIGLVDAIGNRVIGNIAIPDFELKEHELPRRLNPKSIGIITGNGPDSGIALWQGINKNIVNILGNHFLGDISLPKVSLISVPAMGLSMELDQREETTWEALLDAVKELKDQKIEILALACHTTHYFTHRIRDVFENESQRFISMPEVVIRHIEENNITDLAILGINYVADLGHWSAYARLNEFNVEKLSYETLKKFHQLGYDVKKMSLQHKNFQRLIGLIKSDVKSNNVIIALTELSILLQGQSKSARSSEKNIVDVLDLYGKAIAEESLGIKEY